VVGVWNGACGDLAQTLAQVTGGSSSGDGRLEVVRDSCDDGGSCWKCAGGACCGMGAGEWVGGGLVEGGVAVLHKCYESARTSCSDPENSSMHRGSGWLILSKQWCWQCWVCPVISCLK
jgi:hypothetical protein